MIKILAIVLTIGGMISLIMGVLGIFGDNMTSLNPWALTILGGVFFIAGVSMLKYRKDQPAPSEGE
ncbi:hypothetical protein [Aurantibacter aestuarii]|uniref:Uncharacterized protein n=1 Tax=Aurantibacter aestuarii TaxID=1266046 RepID=A0A2T1NG34_9FLAO|nr:hypothetical protein [Aurantibacter aestuarii]PSG91742.1 hypothetical protein C7H52_01100 [Aurantibacter aestuarii]